MRHVLILAASLSILGASAALAQSDTPPPAPPPQQQAAAGNQNTDMGCRRQAATASGYTSSTAADSDVAHHYADAYYSCMDAAYGPPSPDYAYGPPPPPPSPYYYGPYPYPYYYPPYYYGPGVSFGFRFGGGHGRWR